MGTSIVRYECDSGDECAWGVLRGDAVFSIDRQIADHRELMQLYFLRRDEFDAAICNEALPLLELNLCAPISSNIQIFCQGLNYADHRIEGGLDSGSADEENLIFTKAASSICGPSDDIMRPADCQLLDYEIELGLVLKEGVSQPRVVGESELESLIGGLVIANDVSARDAMFGAPAMQWFKGKSQRTFCPMGPVLYLLDPGDLSQLYEMELTLKLNGEVKQNASTDLLIHKPAATLSEISSFANIQAGDCILTGTPGGVLLNMDLRTGLSVLLNMRNDTKRREKFVAAQLARTRFLEGGDCLELSIRSLDGSINLGKQKSTVVDA